MPVPEFLCECSDFHVASVDRKADGLFQNILRAYSEGLLIPD